ncbi:MAG TPA: hypothetical protein VJT82_03205 [Pyrinomonadaceae bacterium]|nr:hypothetical protein [Pyrinomonadaceae bacterium]
MKRGRLFKAISIAALLFLGAAIDAPAQKRASRGSKKTTNKTVAATAVASPAKSEADATPAVVTPAKVNRRDVPVEQAPAPVPSPEKKEAAPSTAATDADADAVRYSYEFKQPDFYIRHILVEHDAAGRGTVSFERKGSEELFTDPVEISPAALGRIKAAWDGLKFLDSQESYQSDKQFPHLGTMTLAMKRGGRERKADFNWTHNELAAALVKEYRRVSDQQLFVFDVTLARQYQPSDTVKLFKHLETLIERDELSDSAQLVPLLRDLTTDERIPLMARNHATRLLKKIEK